MLEFPFLRALYKMDIGHVRTAVPLREIYSFFLHGTSWRATQILRFVKIYELLFSRELPVRLRSIHLLMPLCLVFSQFCHSFAPTCNLLASTYNAGPLYRVHPEWRVVRALLAGLVQFPFPFITTIFACNDYLETQVFHTFQSSATV